MVENPITPEQLENNIEYKVTKKLLKQKFPWIVDVRFDPETLNDYNLIFLDLVVDTKSLMEFLGNDVQLESFTKSYFKKLSEFTCAFLNVAFKNFSYEDGKELTDDIEDVMSKVKQTPAMPYEMKLPPRRKFAISQYVLLAPKETEIEE